ncbi:MAG TPA: hypothetical protein VGO47_13835, partial [Chlamydiales bacterium]|nr:hypothetical protein [Chlamydiales bacterium]
LCVIRYLQEMNFSSFKFVQNQNPDVTSLTHPIRDQRVRTSISSTQITLQVVILRSRKGFRLFSRPPFYQRRGM